MVGQSPPYESIGKVRLTGFPGHIHNPCYARFWGLIVIEPRRNYTMFPYTIDEPIELPLTCSVEVTIDFPAGKRWLFFVTPDLLARVGDFVQGTQSRLHLGERHMIVVSNLSSSVIDSVLRQLASTGELESRTLPLSGEA